MIYLQKENFKYNGLPLSKAYDDVIEHDLNGIYKLTFKLPIDSTEQYKLIQKNSLIKASEHFRENGYNIFRVHFIDKEQDFVQFTAYQLVFDLAKKHVKPLNVMNLLPVDALKFWLESFIDPPNRTFKYWSDETSQRIVYTSIKKDNEKARYAINVLVEMANESKLDLDFNVDQITLGHVGKDTQYLFTTNKNITSFALEDNYDEVITRIRATSTFKPEYDEEKHKQKQEAEMKKLKDAHVAYNKKLADEKRQKKIKDEIDKKIRAEKLKKLNYEKQKKRKVKTTTKPTFKTDAQIRNEINKKYQTAQEKANAQKLVAEANKKKQTDEINKLKAKQKAETEKLKQEVVLNVVVDSPFIDDYPEVYEQAIENNDIKTIDELTDFAESFFSVQNIDKPKREMKIGLEVLDDTDVNLGDSVIVRYLKHNVDEKMRVISTKYSPMNRKYLNVSFGSKQMSFATQSSNLSFNQSQGIAQGFRSESEAYFEMMIQKEKENFDAHFEYETDLIKEKVKEIDAKAKADVQVMDAKITSEINAAKADILNNMSESKSNVEAIVKAEVQKKEASFNDELQKARTDFASGFTDLQSKLIDVTTDYNNLSSTFKSQLDTQLATNKSLLDSKITDTKTYIDREIRDSKTDFNTLLNREKTSLLNDVNRSTDTKINNLSTTTDNKINAAKTEAIKESEKTFKSLNALNTEAIDKIKEKVDKAHVGEVNLLKNAKKEMGPSYYVYPNYDLSPIFNAYPEGTKFSLSFDVKSADTSNVNTVTLYGSGEYMLSPIPRLEVTTDWTRVKLEGFVPKKNSSNSTTTRIGFYGGSNNGNLLSIKNVQLQTGTIATDYTLNIDDVEAQINIVADSISAKAIEAVHGDIGYLRTNILTSNSISSNMIATGSITTDKLSSNSITSDKIATNSIASNKIMSGAITSDKLSSNSVTADKLFVTGALIDKLYSNYLFSNKITSDNAVINTIKTNALTAVYADVDKLRSRIINSESITSDKLYVNSAMIDKLFTNSLMSNKIIGDYAIINTMKTKALESVNANIGTLRTNLLTSNSIKASMLDVDSAFITKLMTNSMLASRLVADYGFIGSIKTKALEAVYADVGNLRSKIITADSINASALNVDYALVNKLVSNYSFVSTLTAQSAFIKSIKAIELDATRITGGVLQSQSGSMRWNLNGNSLDFYNDSKIIFHSLYNSLYYSNSGTCGFVQFSQTYGTSYPAVVIGTSGTTDDNSNTGNFSGLKAHTGRADREGLSEVNIIADKITFDSHGGDVNTGGWTLEPYRKGSSIYRAFYGNNPTKYKYELGQSGNRFNKIWTEGINENIRVINYTDGDAGIMSNNLKFGIQFGNNGFKIVYKNYTYDVGEILKGTSWRV